jgi:hypothetical protein
LSSTCARRSGSPTTRAGSTRCDSVAVSGHAGEHDPVEVDRALAHEEPRPLRLGEPVHVVDEPSNPIGVALDLRQRELLVVDEPVAQRLDARGHPHERAAKLVRDVRGGRAAQLVLAAQGRREPVHRLGQARDLTPAAGAAGARLELAAAHASRRLGQPLQRPREVQGEDERERQGEAAGDGAGRQQQPAHPGLEVTVEALGRAVDPGRSRVVRDDRPDLLAADEDRHALAGGPVGARRRRADHRLPVGSEHDDLVPAALRELAQRDDRPLGPAAGLEVGARGHLGRVRRREAQVALSEVVELRVDRVVDDHRGDEDARECDQHHGPHQVRPHPEEPREPHVGSTPMR